MTLIRLVTSADIPEIERIAEESKLSAWSHQDYIDEIKRQDSIFFVTEAGGQKILGFIVGRIVPGPDAEIYNIAVRQAVRRQGFGQILLTKFIEKCAGLGVNNIWLEVRGSNVNAINFYIENGFVEIFLRPRFYTNPVEDACVMKLAIKTLEPVD